MNTLDFEYTGDDVLEVMSLCAPNRNNYIEKLIRKSFDLDTNSQKKNILEFGAGRGEFINRFKKDSLLNTFVVELDENYLNTLSQNHQGFSNIDELPDSMDFIYLIDVLEHLEHDEEFLSKFYQKLKPNGMLFIYVPARQELFSKFDEKIGHFRRYDKQGLNQKIVSAGFQLKKIQYHEFLGYGAAWYNKLFSSNGNLNPKAVKIYDKFIVPTTNLFEKFIPPFIGKSLYACAYKI